MLAACGSGGGGDTATQIDTGGTPPTANSSTGTPTPVVGGVSETQPTSPSTTPDPKTGAGASQPAMQADATKARFRQPIGIAIDADGNLYVADSLNYTIRKITPSGLVTTLAGSPGASGNLDGIGAAARFMFLTGIAVDAAGNVYAVDNSAIRKITRDGVVSTLAGTPGSTGDADGIGAAAQFNRPWGIAADATGNLYVADSENHLIRKVTPAGVVSTLAGTRGMRGHADGSRATATFLGPQGIALDTSGNLYLTDWFGPPAPNIPEGSTFIRKIAADGAVSTLAGNLASEFGDAILRDTFAIAADAAGNVYVAASRNVRKVSSSGTVSILAGPSTQFDSLQGIAIDAAGNLYVADTSANAIDKVTQTGVITVLAGKPGEAGSTDVP